MELILQNVPPVVRLVQILRTIQMNPLHAHRVKIIMTSMDKESVSKVSKVKFALTRY